VSGVDEIERSVGLDGYASALDGDIELGVRGVGEDSAVAPSRALVANLDLGIGGMASNNAGTRELLDVETEPLRQFGPFAKAHGAPPLGQSRERRCLGVGRNRGVHHPRRLTPG
jgi:hypothetical protein